MAAASSFPLASGERLLPGTHERVWLVVGVILTALVGNRFNVAVLGWFAAVPWLVYLRRTSGWKSRAICALAVQLGTFFQVLKIVTEHRSRWRTATVSVGGLVLSAHIFGAFRLYRPLPGPLVTVATVSTDIGLGADGTLPSPEEVATANDALFSRSRTAMQRGAELVVWNEGSTVVEASREEAFLAREHAIGGAGVVVVPSSDWRGIDPYHTQMARVRGIEGGFSVVRSVRWATSGAFDALGRTRGTSSYFEGERLMIARVPVTQIPTLYTHIGDALPFAALGILLASGWAFARSRRAGER